MAEKDDLYTDYALQMFSSYVSEDLNTMETLLESFKDEDKNIDELFMPGLIYGLMYHMATIFKLVSKATDTPVDKLLSDYAMDYAVAREHLMDNPLLNVNKAKLAMEQILDAIKQIEDMFDDDDNDF